MLRIQGTNNATQANSDIFNYLSHQESSAEGKARIKSVNSCSFLISHKCVFLQLCLHNAKTFHGA